MSNIDIDKVISKYNQRDSRKPVVEWTVEESKSVQTVAGRDPVTIQRTLKPNSDGVRNIRISRGKSRVNIDIQSAHLIAIVMKMMSREYVPEALREESIVRDNDVDNIAEGEQ